MTEEASLQLANALRAKVQREHLKAPGDVKTACPVSPSSSSAVTSKSTSRCCWLCGIEVSLRFRLKDTSALCFKCFRMAYIALVLPEINTAERRAGDALLLEAIERAHKEEDDNDAYDRTYTSFVMSASVMRNRQNESSSGTRKKGSPFSPSDKTAQLWNCPGCTFINPLNSQTCEVCGYDNPGAVICPVCRAKCSVAVGVQQTKCSNGQMHLVWRCGECTQLNCHDGDACTHCGKPRFWACVYCTAQHSQERCVDGLRYCSTCGNYNTPEDVLSGQVKVDAEKHKASLLAADTIETGVVFGVNDAGTLAERERQEDIARHERRLKNRLEAFSIHRQVQKSDGNCLFAALAHQLFGNGALHAVVRSCVVAYMKENAEDYMFLFDGEPAFREYVSQMRDNGFWGDELCLNAAARCFRMNIHVITSEPVRWHLVFQHQQLGDSVASPKLPRPTAHHAGEAFASSSANRTKSGGSHNSSSGSGGDALCVFLAYLSPVHYDDISPMKVRTIQVSDLLLPQINKMFASENKNRSSSLPKAATSMPLLPHLETTPTTTTAHAHGNSQKGHGSPRDNKEGRKRSFASAVLPSSSSPIGSGGNSKHGKTHSHHDKNSNHQHNTIVGVLPVPPQSRAWGATPSPASSQDGSQPPPPVRTPSRKSLRP